MSVPRSQHATPRELARPWTRPRGLSLPVRQVELGGSQDIRRPRWLSQAVTQARVLGAPATAAPSAPSPQGLSTSTGVGGTGGFVCGSARPPARPGAFRAVTPGSEGAGPALSRKPQTLSPPAGLLLLKVAGGEAEAVPALRGPRRWAADASRSSSLRTVLESWLGGWPARTCCQICPQPGPALSVSHSAHALRPGPGPGLLRQSSVQGGPGSPAAQVPAGETTVLTASSWDVQAAAGAGECAQGALGGKGPGAAGAALRPPLLPTGKLVA